MLIALQWRIKNVNSLLNFLKPAFQHGFTIFNLDRQWHKRSRLPRFTKLLQHPCLPKYTRTGRNCADWWVILNIPDLF